MNIRKFTRAGTAAAVAAALFGLAACGTASTPAAAPSTASSSTASSGTSAPSSASSAAAASAPSTTGAMPMPPAPAGPFKPADVTFAQQMIVHHRGAITMSDLASTRASSAEVKTLAAQIKAAQDPEIKEMSAWLAVWAPSTDMNGMPNSSSATATGGAMAGMGGGATGSAMPGMMTDAQMGQLAAASGADFDKLFLQLMIVHHQGALTMAETEKAQGKNPAALALAASIITSQSAQITTMQGLLAKK
ncbi:uncharacterized protein (DUF305 family) [Nakamurella sp. UYEF19]|uniref:DUF305 domain-containing protein n=1 Tax=Nakamurella sp. UYEF19 TaxID=1756392 RepID=UPI0033960B08